MGKMPAGTWAGVYTAAPVRLLSMEAVARATGAVDGVADTVGYSVSVTGYSSVAQVRLSEPKHVVEVLVVTVRHGSSKKPPVMDAGSEGPA